jgi:hypothetical protein
VRTGAGVVVSPGLPLDPNAITAVVLEWRTADSTKSPLKPIAARSMTLGLRCIRPSTPEPDN